MRSFSSWSESEPRSGKVSICKRVLSSGRRDGTASIAFIGSGRALRACLPQTVLNVLHSGGKHQCQPDVKAGEREPVNPAKCEEQGTEHRPHAPASEPVDLQVDVPVQRVAGQD